MKSKIIKIIATALIITFLSEETLKMGTGPIFAQEIIIAKMGQSPFSLRPAATGKRQLERFYDEARYWRKRAIKLRNGLSFNEIYSAGGYSKKKLSQLLRAILKLSNFRTKKTAETLIAILKLHDKNLQDCPADLVRLNFACEEAKEKNLRIIQDMLNVDEAIKQTVVQALSAFKQSRQCLSVLKDALAQEYQSAYVIGAVMEVLIGWEDADTSTIKEMLSEIRRTPRIHSGFMAVRLSDKTNFYDLRAVLELAIKLKEADSEIPLQAIERASAYLYLESVGGIEIAKLLYRILEDEESGLERLLSLAAATDNFKNIADYEIGGEKFKEHMSDEVRDDEHKFRLALEEVAKVYIESYRKIPRDKRVKLLTDCFLGHIISPVVTTEESAKFSTQRFKQLQRMRQQVATEKIEALLKDKRPYVWSPLFAVLLVQTARILKQLSALETELEKNNLDPKLHDGYKKTYEQYEKMYEFLLIPILETSEEEGFPQALEEALALASKGRFPHDATVTDAEIEKIIAEIAKMAGISRPMLQGIFIKAVNAAMKIQKAITQAA